MFTGIVRGTGTVRSATRAAGACVLTVELGPLSVGVSAGDSVSVDGVCLTVTGLQGSCASFDVSAETLRLTTLGELRVGSRVNLEPSLRMGEALGGHFASGHVDGVGTIRQKRAVAGEVRLEVEADARLTDDMIPKGSVAVDGISLTIAELSSGSFEVSLIPYTLAVTTLRDKGPGDRVNIECDMIGRWVRRLLSGGEAQGQRPPLSIADLEEQGF